MQTSEAANVTAVHACATCCLNLALHDSYVTTAFRALPCCGASQWKKKKRPAFQPFLLYSVITSVNICAENCLHQSYFRSLYVYFVTVSLLHASF